jgi:hypothetical protein
VHPAPDEPTLVAVLSALAGVRRGHRVAVVGTSPRLTAALLAMCGSEVAVDDDADVVVAGAAHDVPLAVTRLAGGGRLVAVAADAGAARRVASGQGLDLRHVQPLGRVVAWSAVLSRTGAPTAPAAGDPTP